MTRRAAFAALLLAGCTATPPPARVAVANDGLPLGVLPRQTLDKGKCAVFLWKGGDQTRLLLMAAADPPFARVVLDGVQRDLPRIEGGGEVGDAQTHTVYGVPGVRLTLDLVIQAREGLADGALIPSGSLALDRYGKDGIVLPVAGLLGCER